MNLNVGVNLAKQMNKLVKRKRCLATLIIALMKKMVFIQQYLRLNVKAKIRESLKVRVNIMYLLPVL